MISMHLLQTLSSNKRERIWNKAKSNAKFTALLGSGKYLDKSVPLSWPTAEFSTHPYNKDLNHQVCFYTFFDVNAWNDPEEIELPYIFCMKSLIVLDKGILSDTTIPNSHYFLTIAFHIFEAFVKILYLCTTCLNHTKRPLPKMIESFIGINKNLDEIESRDASPAGYLENNHLGSLGLLEHT